MANTRKLESEKRNAYCCVYLTNDEKKELKKRAGDVPLSTFIRHKIFSKKIEE